jgi:hypothetical protein
MSPQIDGGFAGLVEEEVRQARALHDPINSAHEGYAVILEELDEFWDECRRKRGDRDPDAMLLELVQVAAMAERTAYDLGLITLNPAGRQYSRGVGIAKHVRPADDAS